MVISLGFGTVSLGQAGNVHLRIWEILLVGIILELLARILIRGKHIIRNNTQFIIGNVFFFSVIISGLNASDTLLWSKQALLLFAMILLFEVVSIQNSAKQLLASMRLIIYPGILVAIWGIIEVLFTPQDLQIYQMGGIIIPRARSFFAEANEFSQYLSLPFSFMLSALIFNRAISGWERRIYYIGLVLVVMAQVMTFSRGGILAFSAAFLALFILLIISRASIGKYIMRTALWLFLVLMIIGLLYLYQPMITMIF